MDQKSQMTKVLLNWVEETKWQQNLTNEKLLWIFTQLKYFHKLNNTGKKERKKKHQCVSVSRFYFMWTTEPFLHFSCIIHEQIKVSESDSCYRNTSVKHMVVDRHLRCCGDWIRGLSVAGRASLTIASSFPSPNNHGACVIKVQTKIQRWLHVNLTVAMWKIFTPVCLNEQKLYRFPAEHIVSNSTYLETRCRIKVIAWNEQWKKDAFSSRIKWTRCIYIDGLQLQIDKIVCQQDIWWSSKFSVFLGDSHTHTHRGTRKHTSKYEKELLHWMTA